LREAIALQIEQTFPGQVVLKNPEDVLSIFLTEDRAFIGLSTAANNLSDWPGGAMRLKMEPFYPARSRLKLEEAFYVFSLFQLDLVDALDIGAAPGGWTSFLLDQGFRVTAIDTGEMDARLLKKANLQFIKQNVQDARLPEESFDLLTCDMSWSPYITCQRIHDFAAQLREDGRAIVTIKLLHQKKVTKTIRDALEILNRNYQVLACKQLFHNRDEVTVYLRKRFR
ncbi:MAG: SAM-dependent methyltransferase, partial [Bacilli bacterium]|nr:SAM-dependent methyltransferase [Bacilli bacterium]